MNFIDRFHKISYDNMSIYNNINTNNRLTLQNSDRSNVGSAQPAVVQFLGSPLFRRLLLQISRLHPNREERTPVILFEFDS